MWIAPFYNFLFPDDFYQLLDSEDILSTINTASSDDHSFEQKYAVIALFKDGAFFAELLKQDFLYDSYISRMLSYKKHLYRP
ncbi:MAG: hypothetical protein HKN31_04420 [Pricia sp.]|nr:hypothetical protein [Pricia sp.]